jgi:parallel beta-helix repeat protein
MVVPTDGMVITQDTVLEPGVYYLPNGVTIAADGVTLDGNGAILVGNNRTGVGVCVEGRQGVTIKGLRLREYYHGIRATDCKSLTITGCQVTSTAEVEPNTIFLDIWLPVDKAYGGGILLCRVEESLIADNDLQHQMNGLLAYHCRRLTVRGNVANYCSGFGFHLHDTSDSLYEHNYADFCCRYEPRGERYGHMGADATGFLIVYKSCRNIFRRNCARLGGDGFFLAGMTPQMEPVGCDENLFEENDGSYSPNIAFEATFSRGNVYRNNFANYCNYGFWLGFSREFVIEGNRMLHNRQAGIAVENGVGFTVRRNTFQACGHGILLWSKYVPEFARSAPDNDTSREWLIEENIFTRCGKGVRIAANQDHGIRPLEVKEGEPTAPHPHDHTIRKNEFQENRVGIELVNTDRTVITENLMHRNVEANIRLDDAQETTMQFNVGYAGGYL